MLTSGTGNRKLVRVRFDQLQHSHALQAISGTETHYPKGAHYIKIGIGRNRGVDNFETKNIIFRIYSMRCLTG